MSVITSAIGKDPDKLKETDDQDVTVVTDASANIAATSQKYLANRGSLVTLTLPTTCVVGEVHEVVGMGAGGWKIAQNASQAINVGSSASTTGTEGYISGAQYTGVRLICDVANTHWIATDAMGAITVA